LQEETVAKKTKVPRATSGSKLSNKIRKAGIVEAFDHPLDRTIFRDALLRQRRQQLLR
jgi:hypothetical protein